MIRKVLFLYKTPRERAYRDWEGGKGPDTILYGANHLEKLGFDLKIYDFAFSKSNPLLWLFYPVQYLAGKLTVPAARETVTWPSSRGWRRASNV